MSRLKGRKPVGAGPDQNPRPTLNRLTGSQAGDAANQTDRGCKLLFFLFLCFLGEQTSGRAGNLRACWTLKEPQTTLSDLLSIDESGGVTGSSASALTSGGRRRFRGGRPCGLPPFAPATLTRPRGCAPRGATHQTCPAVPRPRGRMSDLPSPGQGSPPLPRTAAALRALWHGGRPM